MLGFLFPFLIIVHVVLCIFLILIILVQNDKGGGLAGALGGMGGGAAFSGASAATLITKITQVVALISFGVILVLNILAFQRDQKSSVESELKNTRKSLGSVVPNGYDGAAKSGDFFQGIPQQE